MTMSFNESGLSGASVAQPALLQKPSQRLRKTATAYLLRRPIWLLCAVLVVLFSLQSSFFLTTFNLSNILFQCSLIGFLAVGLTPVVISGNIDLSVGAIVGLSSCLAIGLQPLGLLPAVAVAIAAATGIGALNGVIVEKTGINSFIVTLAAMIGVRGLAFLYAGDTSLSAIDDRLAEFGHLSIGPVSVISLGFLASVAIVNWVITNTRHGRNTYAIGGNRDAAVNAGIQVSPHIIGNFALSGAMAGICGVAMAADLGAATPSYGKDYELWAVIAVVLGGTSLRGGAGTAIGTFAAVLTLAVLRNGLNLIHVSPFYILVVMGLALIGATIIDSQLNRRPARDSE
jgi:ribose transport system permease protein